MRQGSDAKEANSKRRWLLLLSIIGVIWGCSRAAPPASPPPPPNPHFATIRKLAELESAIEMGVTVDEINRLVREAHTEMKLVPIPPQYGIALSVMDTGLRNINEMQAMRMRSLRKEGWDPLQEIKSADDPLYEKTQRNRKIWQNNINAIHDGAARLRMRLSGTNDIAGAST